MKVVCISGKARHGKDTFACFLKNTLESRGKSVLIIHYADQLKYILREYYGWDGKKNESGRELLQRVGTDIARARDPDIWVKYVVMFLQVFGGEYDYVLIPDCRFPNEVDSMYSYFDTIHVRIDRGDFDNGMTVEQKQHISETALDSHSVDQTIMNCDGLKHLKDAADTFAEFFLFDDEEVVE